MPFNYEAVNLLVRELSSYLTIQELEILLNERKNIPVSEESC